MASFAHDFALHLKVKEQKVSVDFVYPSILGLSPGRDETHVGINVGESG